jgi:tetratricopeptide (TPR) repeat protein
MTVQQLALRRKLAMLDFEDGQYLEAEQGLTGLVDELRESTDAGAGYELGRALLDRATARRVLNRWDDAAGDVDECEQRASSMPDVAASSLLTNVYSMRAQLHLTEQWADRDTIVATAALDALVASGTRGWWVDEARANLAYRERDWEQAAARYVHVAAAVEREGWGRGVAACDLRAGTALLELGRVEEAGSHLERAHAYFTELGPSDLRADTERQFARLLVLQAKPDEAWEHITIALSLVETSVRTFRSLFDQQRYLADKDAYYQHAFAVALAAGGGEGDLRALSVAERAKSFYLCQLLANADVPLFDGVDAADVERLRELEDRLDALESQVRASGAAMEARATLEAERDAVAREREQLFGELMREHPRWASAQVPLPFDAARDLASLPEGWCALSAFWFGAAELHFFLARAGEPVMHFSDVWSADELEALRTSQEELRTATTGELFVHPVIPVGLRERVLPPEILAMLPPDARLLVSPHGILRGVPLRLVAGPERAVQYIPSLALMNLARPHESGSDVLLLGCEQDGFGDPPLPGVRRELEAAAEIWGGTPIVLDEAGRLGADAPAPEAWDRYRVIQIACHGELAPQRPLDGALLLGRSALRMSELFTLRLNAELVCLSACDLGRLGERVGGARQAGDEWLGFVMPLLYAGARSILVSLWKAHDGTAARLVPELHRAIHQDREPADALRDALAAVEDAPEGFWTNWYLVGFPAGTATGTQQRGKDS